jgi:hypothetical protein
MHCRVYDIVCISILKSSINCSFLINVTWNNLWIILFEFENSNKLFGHYLKIHTLSIPKLWAFQSFVRGLINNKDW